ncbi:allophanate hydrolase [Halarcobacter ebronensis]|uniref:Allophanate hydrolase n=1 Tax=Halarcobacter ebronensis TaxID=1462615 RepID=A0A4Q0YCN9_9BACT|nr:5-oxoprolinase subunit PxpB [Halarcobacter ebronensis]RXJ68132.1 allophanate hydrolase [Halarcobacter ebronensis]
MNIEIASVDSVIIYFGDTITKENSLKVKAAYKRLIELNNSALIEIIPSYVSILITYDLFKYNYKEIKELLEKELKDIKISSVNEESKKIVTIDVYYDKEVGFDLEEVAKKANLSVDEVIALHSNKLYDVYAIGFLPGFAYLASVDERLKTSRLETPRKKIPKGSVAIADTQTAVYPKDSPGGWNILGRTAFKLFDKSLETLSLITIDSKVKFNPITKEQFLSQGGEL